MVCGIKNKQSMIVVILLSICTCSYLRPKIPGIIDNKKTGFLGILGKMAVIGDRLSPYVSLLCIFMACMTLFYR
ncbi:conserved small protein [Cryptosporidium ryanae]|uniref:conserved small protein n=1 Tax=Cryptosporidium ryanae TaxID=515981 RepID=UPI00351A79ED|nr:conserved small protein [Cryptosporidium ryanae]